MLELKLGRTVESSQVRATAQTRQAHRLMLALVVLLVAIAVLLVTDRQFWFGSNQLILDSDGTESTVAPHTGSAPNAANHSQPAPVPAAKKHVSATSSLPPKNTGSPVVATTR